jgi:two-component system phosphate regulon sensor histidine kinase PhoR
MVKDTSSLQSRHVSNQTAGELPQGAAHLALQWSPSPVLLLDSAGAVRYANQAALTELRSNEKEVIGKQFLDLLDEGSRGKAGVLLSNAQRTPGPIYELNQIAGDGAVVIIGYRALVFPQLDGTEGILLLGTSMADTVAVTERLVALNRRLQALFTITASASRSLVLEDVLAHALEVAIAELELRAGLVVLKPTPFEPPQVHAEPSTEAWQLAAHHGFSAQLAVRWGDDHPFVAMLRGRLADDQPVVHVDQIEAWGLQASDLEVPTSPLLTLAAVPLHSDDRQLGWLIVLADRYRALAESELATLHTIGNLLGPIISTARLYAALREASGQLSAVLDSIDSGVMLVDRAGIVRYANARLGKLFATDVRYWPGQPRGAVLQLPLQLLERSSTTFGGDMLEWRRDSQRRVLHRMEDDVFDSAGELLGMIEVYTDVTDIEEVNQLKDEFVAAAAHDLKTPVTAIKGYAQIGLRLAQRIDQPRLVKYLDMVNTRSDELTYLMDSLLDVSRIQAGRLRLEVEPLLVHTLIAKVMQYFEFDLQRQHRTVDVELPAEPLTVEWDAPRMERVLINLISNALKYSPGSSAVGLRVRRIAATASEPAQVELAVTDHGIGIPADERALIFERFYRVRETVEAGFKGTGLGLYICYSVVGAHGGRIWADAALHGGPGTTVYVYVPECVK